MAYNYIIRKDNQVTINNELILTNQQVVDAMNFANEALRIPRKKFAALFRW